MLRELVSQARSGTSPELEAVTAERDFFREKYAEQISIMEAMKTQLKDSQRTIEKLRNQVLDLEVEKSRLMEQGGTGKGESGSTGTSDTCMTYEDESLRSGVDNAGDCARVEETDADKTLDAVAAEQGMASPKNAQEVEGREDAALGLPDAKGTEAEDDEQSTHDEDESDEEEGESGSDEDDEAEKIRAKAERMLLWANYQTSKNSTPNTSLIREDNEDRSEASGLRPDTPSSRGGIVYSLPTSLGRRQDGVLDDDSTIDSSRVGSMRSGRTSSSNNGRFGNMLNSLRDMIDPESESEAESDDECTNSDDSC